MSAKREFWVDYVKLFACILVVMGHFFQSMVKANILPDNNLYNWFNTTIYYFHVPLFFICSGYLYQKYSVVNSLSSWKGNVIKKAVVFGIPYFVFSFVTWFLKKVFSGSINNEVGGLFDTLVLHPTAPYWYLYVLFFIFILIPTFKERKGIYIFLSIALGLRCIKEIWSGASIYQIYIVSKISENLIWFVLGMFITFLGVKKIKKPTVGAIFGIVFIVLSALLYKIENGLISFGLGFIACIAVLMIIIGINETKVLKIGSLYTMPIFLMHTIFAAPIRTILIKFGIRNEAVHIVPGLTISFLGPVVAIIVLQKIKLDWIVYSGKLLHKRKIE